MSTWSSSVNGAEFDAIKSELEQGHPVTVVFSADGAIGATFLQSTLFRLVGRNDVKIRLANQRKALADRGYPEQLLGMEDPVREVMLANPEVDYHAAIRLAYPDKQ